MYEVRPTVTNHGVPSGAIVTSCGYVPAICAVVNSWMVPLGVILPIEAEPWSVNQPSPFVSRTIEYGREPAGSPAVYSITVPDEVMVPIAGVPPSVNHIVVPFAGAISHADAVAKNPGVVPAV